MGAGDNRRLVEEAIQAYNAKDIEAFVGLHNTGLAGILWYDSEQRPSPEYDEIRARMDEHVTAFPDAKLRIVDLMADDDRVWFEGELTGTHKGPLKGPDGRVLPPSGRFFTIAYAVHLTIRDGKVAESHVFMNQRELLRQLRPASPS